jgi:tetratricopeptide (TPR) repeat protein
MKRQTVGLAAVAMVLTCGTLVWAGAAAPPPSASMDPMIKGLSDRGLTTLLEYYQKTYASVTNTSGGTIPSTGGDKVRLALTELAKAKNAVNIGEREESFKRAKQFYEQAIADAEKSSAASSDAADRSKLRIQVMRVRLDLANMIFREWLKSDLDFLEVTDRRSGDRAHATELMKTAADQFRSISVEVQKALADIDHMDPAAKSKAFNISIELRRIERESKYSEAWITYYYGWILKSDFKPDKSKGELSKIELLNDSITKFGDYTALPDKNSPKWYALMVQGLAYRDLGKYTEALQRLAEANKCNALPEGEREGIQIRLVFERALTLLKKGDYADVRKSIDDARQFWGGKLTTSVYGLSLDLLEAESYVDEGLKNDKPDLKQKGMDLFMKKATEPNPWPVLVQGILDVKFPKDAADLDKAAPLTLWLRGQKLMDESRNADGTVKDEKGLIQAAEAFLKFCEKVGVKDPKYYDGQYLAGACFFKLNRKTEAGIAFYKVASGAPDYKYAKEAAEYYITLMGDAYQEAKGKSDLVKTEKARKDFETALKWYCESAYGAKKYGQWFNYGLILQDGSGDNLKKAAAQFARIPEEAGEDIYLNARYWVPLCDLKYFREKEAMGTKDVAVARAQVVSKELVDYAEFALKRANDPKTDPANKEALIRQARLAYFNAIDILCYPEVGLYEPAGPLLETIGKKFELTDEMKGSIIGLKMTRAIKLNKMDEAMKVLDEFLKVAKPDEVGPVIQSILKSQVASARSLVERNQLAQAAEMVEKAGPIGERLRQWLEAHKTEQPDWEHQIETIRYDLAELQLAVGNFVKAKALYDEISAGNNKPWVVDDKKNEALKMDLVYGLARCYEGLAGQEANADTQKKLFETAFEVWTVILRAEMGRDINRADPTALHAQQQVIWDRTYHVYYSRFKSDPQKNAQEVYETMKSRMAIIAPEKLGGNEAALQKKFDDLYAEVAKLAGASAAQPAVTSTAPAATDTATTPATTGTEAVQPAPAATSTAPAAPAPTATEAATPAKG